MEKCKTHKATVSNKVSHDGKLCGDEIGAGPGIIYASTYHFVTKLLALTFSV